MLVIIGPLTILGCLFLFFNLPLAAMLVLPVWTAVGCLIYFGYSRSHSHLGQGRVEVHEDEAHDLAPHVPGVDAPH
jgi:APA family basic amino acid/polyamine antiporter